MGSKANDSRIGTIGAPSTSGISFRLTPAPEAVMRTSSAPTRIGAIEAPSAALSPAVTPVRIRCLRWTGNLACVMARILSIDSIPLVDTPVNVARRARRVPRFLGLICALRRRRRHAALERNELNAEDCEKVCALVARPIRNIGRNIERFADADSDIPVADFLHAAVRGKQEPRCAPRADKRSRFNVIDGNVGH